MARSSQQIIETQLGALMLQVAVLTADLEKSQEDLARTKSERDAMMEQLAALESKPGTA